MDDYDTDEREEDFGIMKKRSPFNRGGAMDPAAESYGLISTGLPLGDKVSVCGEAEGHGVIVDGAQLIVHMQRNEGESPVNTPLTMKPELVIRSSVARI